jgi:hypothetical protein
MVMAVAMAGAVTLLGPVYSTRPPTDIAGYSWFIVGAGMVVALVYGVARAVGMILVGVYGTMRDGSEFVVDWRALRHDLPLCRTRVVRWRPACCSPRRPARPRVTPVVSRPMPPAGRAAWTRLASRARRLGSRVMVGSVARRGVNGSLTLAPCQRCQPLPLGLPLKDLGRDGSHHTH